MLTNRTRAIVQNHIKTLSITLKSLIFYSLNSTKLEFYPICNLNNLEILETDFELFKILIHHVKMKKLTYIKFKNIRSKSSIKFDENKNKRQI